MTMPGLFLSFEGLDGSGKTTQIRRLAGRLRLRGLEVVEAVEPGGTAIGKRIREILLSPEHMELDARAELLLYFAARAQNVKEVIIPALLSGAVVLADRYTDSTIAYQGAGRGLGENTVRVLHKIACGEWWPRLTICLDIDKEAARARMAGRGLADRMETNGAEFFERARAAFHEIARNEPERFRLVDALGGEEEVEARVWAEVGGLLGEG
jgi:dTMP kinase